MLKDEKNEKQKKLFELMNDIYYCYFYQKYAESNEVTRAEIDKIYDDINEFLDFLQFEEYENDASMLEFHTKAIKKEFETYPNLYTCLTQDDYKNDIQTCKMALQDAYDAFINEQFENHEDEYEQFTDDEEEDWLFIRR